MTYLNASKERRSVTVVGSSATLRFDLIYTTKQWLFPTGLNEVDCATNISPLEAELLHMISNIPILIQVKHGPQYPIMDRLERGKMD